MATRAVTHISLCAGAGGLDLGLRLALGDTLRTVCYVEREAYAAATLVARMEDEALDQAPIWDDLKSFDGGAWRGCVDIISAGYPCQPWSVAGRQLGESDERDLWPDVARIVAGARPTFVFLENVPGVAAVFAERERPELEAMGYVVATRLFSAAEVGASQRRLRFFALAYCRRQHERLQQWVHGAESARGSGDVASSQGYSSGFTEQEQQRRPTSRPRANCEDVARADSGLTEPKDDSVCPRRDIAGDGLCDVVYSQGERAEPIQHTGLSRSPFPPGPGDGEAWARVLGIAPSLEPAVCGVADGMAPRVERLRLCGNGVVPLAAAYAFCTLLADLAD